MPPKFNSPKQALEQGVCGQHGWSSRYFRESVGGRWCVEVRWGVGDEKRRTFVSDDTSDESIPGTKKGHAAAAAVAQKPKKTRSRPPAPAPVPAPALAAVPPVPSREMLGGLGAAASGIDHLPPALAPFRAQDWSLASTTAPVTSDTATALVAGCTLHDLAPEDKRKVAKLIKQVVEYAESKKRLEAELDETHVRLDACERSRDDAMKAEETRKAELRALTNKLDKALATVEAYRRREKRDNENAARNGARTFSVPWNPLKSSSM